MKRITTILTLTHLFILSHAQIDCTPKIGDRFFPIHEGVNLRSEPSLTSTIVFKTPDNEGVLNKGVKLICQQDGFQNEFVKVMILFWDETMGDYGINPETLWLYDKSKEEGQFIGSFKDFYAIIQDNNKLRELYGKLQNQKWFLEWGGSEDYDMSTFDTFYSYWIKYPESDNDIQFVLQNHEKIAFVHKSVIETNGYFAMPTSGFNLDSEYFYKKLDEIKEMEASNDCDYGSNFMFSHLKALVETLLDEEQYFKAIQEITACEHYFSDPVERLKMQALKMKASYYDGNYEGSLAIAKKLLSEYQTGRITNSKTDYYGDIDMSDVYGFAIGSCLNTEKYTEGLNLSNQVLKNEAFQYGKYVEFHARLLGSLGKEDEACSFLNKHYLNGHQGARDMYQENCK